MKKTKIKSTKQFNINNEIKPAYLGEIDYSVLMYDKESIDNISSNLSSDYTEKNTLLSNEIFTEINLLSSNHNADFNKLSNLIEKNIDFIQAISVDLSDDISNIVDFNNKISALNNDIKNIPSENVILSNYFGADTNYNLASWIDGIDDAVGDVVDNLSVIVPDNETDPKFAEWKNSAEVILGKDAQVNNPNDGIAVGLSASSVADSITIGKKASATSNASIAIGLNSYANGHKSTVIGSSSTAYKYSTIIGNDSKSQSSEHTIILGQSSTISNNSENSIIVGQNTKISESDSGIVIGQDSILSDSKYSIMFGLGNQIHDSVDSIAIGDTTEISASNNSIAIGAGAKIYGTRIYGRNTAIGFDSAISGTQSTAIGFNANVEANSAIQLGTGTNTNHGTLQFRDYPLVDNNGKIFEERIPDKIINIVNNLSNMTDLSDGLSIVNFLSEKIDTEIANLSNKHKEDIDELSSNLEITNDSISELSNEFKSEIFNIKTENFDSIYEIYDEINNLSGSVSQDIENLYNDLSDEIQGINDAIIDLSDVLSNEVFILNSKIDNLSNGLENSINEVINSKITNVIESENTGLVTSDTIYKAISKKFIQTEISSDSEINLIPNAFHSVITTNSTIKPLLKLPFGNFDDSEDIILKSGDEITVALRSEDGSGAQFELKNDDENNKALIYTDNGLLNNSTDEKGSMLVKAEYDGTFWFLHTHKYTRLVDGVITITLNGSNQITTSHLYDKRQSFIVNAQDDGSFTFTINNNNNIDQEWLSLFGNGKCQLLKWATNINDNSVNPTKQTTQTFTWDNSYKNSVINLYPIYEVVTVDIADVTVSTGVIIAGGKSLKTSTTLYFDTILSDYGCDYLTKNIPFKAEITGIIELKNNDVATLYGCFYYPSGDTPLTFITHKKVGTVSETKYLADISSADNKRVLNLYAGSSIDTRANYELVVNQIKIGYNRYNKPVYNTFITW